MNQAVQHQNAVADGFAESLLAFEAELRGIGEEQECLIHAVNASRKLLSYRQAMVFLRKSSSGSFVLRSASSVGAIDRASPQVRWLEAVVSNMADQADVSAQQKFSMPAYCDSADDETATYPFPEFIWSPLAAGDQVFGGMLLARERQWTESEVLLAQRVAKIYAHALLAIKGRRRVFSRFRFTRRRLIIAAALIGIIMLLPVHITAIAPVEVVPSNPYVVAAPFDGVIREIQVDRNQPVDASTALIAFEDTRLRNNFELASQEEAVARARLQKVSQGAIHNVEAKHELAIVDAEHRLAKAERKYAAELLEKSVLRAETAGIAIYSDKRDWEGRPVSAGQAILQIADASQIEFEIRLPVRDSLVLRDGARVKIFLDSDPLNPIEAVLNAASYQASPDKRGILSYRVSAAMGDDEVRVPRIGVQGSAQIFSEKAPLVYVLLRRPLAVFRQITGW